MVTTCIWFKESICISLLKKFNLSFSALRGKMFTPNQISVEKDAKESNACILLVEKPSNDKNIKESRRKPAKT